MKLFKGKPSSGDVCCLYLTRHSIAWVQGSTLGTKRPIIKHCQFLPDGLKVEQDKARVKLFKTLMADQGGKDMPCHVVLSPDYYRLFPLDLPENLPEQEIAAALPWLVKDLIEHSIDETVIDSFPMVTVAGQARKIYVVAAYAEPLKQLQQQIVSAGLNLVCIDIAELSLRDLLAALIEKEAGTALLVFSDNYYQVVVNQGESLYFTRIIHEPGGEWATRPALDTISLDIQRSLDYSQAQMHQAVPVNVLLAPSLTDGDILLAQLSQRLTSVVKPLDVTTLFTFPADIEVAMQVHCLVALGKMLRIGKAQ